MRRGILCSRLAQYASVCVNNALLHERSALRSFLMLKIHCKIHAAMLLRFQSRILGIKSVVSG